MARFDTIRKTLADMDSDQWVHVGQIWGEPAEHQLSPSKPWRVVKNYTTSEWYPKVLAGVKGTQDNAQCVEIYEECKYHLADTLGVIRERLGDQVMRGYARVLQADRVENTLVSDGTPVWNTESRECDEARIMRDSGKWWLYRPDWECMWELGEDEWDVVLKLMSAGWSFI